MVVEEGFPDDLLARKKPDRVAATDELDRGTEETKQQLVALFESASEEQWKMTQDILRIESNGALAPLLNLRAMGDLQYARVDMRDIQSQIDEILYHFTSAVSKYVADLDAHVETIRGRMLSYKDSLDLQKGSLEGMQQKYDACIERMRKNDMQMDFLRGQIVRREAMLHDQRAAYLKELNILKEQLYKKQKNMEGVENRPVMEVLTPNVDSEPLATQLEKALAQKRADKDRPQETSRSKQESQLQAAFDALKRHHQTEIRSLQEEFEKVLAEKDEALTLKDRELKEREEQFRAEIEEYTSMQNEGAEQARRELEDEMMSLKNDFQIEKNALIAAHDEATAAAALRHEELVASLRKEYETDIERLKTQVARLTDDLEKKVKTVDELDAEVARLQHERDEAVEALQTSDAAKIEAEETMRRQLIQLQQQLEAKENVRGAAGSHSEILLIHKIEDMASHYMRLEAKLSEEIRRNHVLEDNLKLANLGGVDDDDMHGRSGSGAGGKSGGRVSRPTSAIPSRPTSSSSKGSKMPGGKDDDVSGTGVDSKRGGSKAGRHSTTPDLPEDVGGGDGASGTPRGKGKKATGRTSVSGHHGHDDGDDAGGGAGGKHGTRKTGGSRPPSSTSRMSSPPGQQYGASSSEEEGGAGHRRGRDVELKDLAVQTPTSWLVQYAKELAKELNLMDHDDVDADDVIIGPDGESDVVPKTQRSRIPKGGRKTSGAGAGGAGSGGSGKQIDSKDPTGQQSGGRSSRSGSQAGSDSGGRPGSAASGRGGGGGHGVHGGAGSDDDEEFSASHGSRIGGGAGGSSVGTGAGGRHGAGAGVIGGGDDRSSSRTGGGKSGAGGAAGGGAGGAGSGSPGRKDDPRATAEERRLKENLEKAILETDSLKTKRALVNWEILFKGLVTRRLQRERNKALASEATEYITAESDREMENKIANLQVFDRLEARATYRLRRARNRLQIIEEERRRNLEKVMEAARLLVHPGDAARNPAISPRHGYSASDYQRPGSSLGGVGGGGGGYGGLAYGGAGHGYGGGMLSSDEEGAAATGSQLATVRISDEEAASGSLRPRPHSAAAIVSRHAPPPKRKIVHQAKLTAGGVSFSQRASSAQKRDGGADAYTGPEGPSPVPPAFPRPSTAPDGRGSTGAGGGAKGAVPRLALTSDIQKGAGDMGLEMGQTLGYEGSGRESRMSNGMYDSDLMRIQSMTYRHMMQTGETPRDLSPTRSISVRTPHGSERRSHSPNRSLDTSRGVLHLPRADVKVNFTNLTQKERREMILQMIYRDSRLSQLRKRARKIDGDADELSGGGAGTSGNISPGRQRGIAPHDTKHPFGGAGTPVLITRLSKTSSTPSTITSHPPRSGKGK